MQRQTRQREPSGAADRASLGALSQEPPRGWLFSAPGPAQPQKPRVPWDGAPSVVSTGPSKHDFMLRQRLLQDRRGWSLRTQGFRPPGAEGLEVRLAADGCDLTGPAPVINPTKPSAKGFRRLLAW